MYALPNWGTSFYPKVFATDIKLDTFFFYQILDSKDLIYFLASIRYVLRTMFYLKDAYIMQNIVFNNYQRL